MKLNKILIAIDDSMESEQAAERGFDLAHHYHTEVVLVNIKPLIISSPGDAGSITSMPFEPGLANDPELVKIQTEVSDNIINRTIEKYAGDLVVNHVSEYGSTAESIVEYSNQINVDLIVIGTHHRSGLDRILSGSIAEHVVRHSNVAVLVVPFLS